MKERFLVKLQRNVKIEMLGLFDEMTIFPIEVFIMSLFLLI